VKVKKISPQTGLCLVCLPNGAVSISASFLVNNIQKMTGDE